MANMIGGITNMAMGTVGTIFSAIAGMKWDKQMSKLLDEDPQYEFDPYVKQRYGMAQTLLNARMPGAQSRERNIYSSGANTMANFQRNATDSSQLLAAAAGSQGQMGEQFNDLANDEAQDYYNRYGMYNEASKGMTEEKRNMFDDAVRRWQDAINIKTAQYKARAGGGQSMANLGGAFGNTSGFGGMGGGMGGN